MKVNQDRAEEALQYLSETDEELADAKVELDRAKYILGRREAHAFLAAKGTVDERKFKAKLTSEYDEAYQDVTRALAHYEVVIAKRKTETLVWEHWRSCEASRRQGS